MTLAEKWLIAAVVFVILEILPPPTRFRMLCLAFGALAAAITAFFSHLLWLSWTAFVIASAAVYPMLVPLAKFLFARGRSSSGNAS